MIMLALCLEPFLRHLNGINGNSEDKVGAFADDISLCVSDVRKIVPRLASLFADFGRYANLHSNIAKCVVVPLTVRSNFAFFASVFENLAPNWTRFRVSDHAEYLGFLLGSGGVLSQRDAAAHKIADTVNRWKNVHAGFFLNRLATNVYILPITSYIG